MSCQGKCLTSSHSCKILVVIFAWAYAIMFSPLFFEQACKSIFPHWFKSQVRAFESEKYAKDVIDKWIDQSNQVQAWCVALLGVCAYFLRNEKNGESRAIVRDVPEALILLASAACVAGSFVAWFIHTKALLGYLLQASKDNHIPDLGHIELLWPFVSQALMLAGGAVMLAVVYSLAWYRGWKE